MAKNKAPVTPAIRALRQAGIAFTGHPYTYIEAGGTGQSAKELGVDEHQVIKTLVMEDDARKPLIVLMHGDRQVSTKSLARRIGARSIQPCDPAKAEKHTGFKVGGTSPFGTRHPMPVYCESSIADLPRCYINGGKRGYLVSLDTQEMLALLKAELVEVARD